MCGIAGLFTLSPLTPAEREDLQAATRSMERRGPDDEAFLWNPHWGLGHRRLSILDPAGGRQPWFDEATGVSLTYNGEIFNTFALRDELALKGHVFRSRCDTEVLLAAYLEWGEACLERLSGMFAFGLVDPRKGLLWLARDALGVKPLFFFKNPSHFAFASSLNALLRFSACSKKVDPGALAHYLQTIRTTLGPRTLLAGVHSLQPGFCAVLDLNSFSFQQRRWWTLPFPGQPQSEITFEAAAREVESRIDQSIEAQLLSDVPLGGFLSGGIDSSILVSGAVRALRKPFTAFSVGYREAPDQEWPFVHKVAAHHGIECRECHLNPDTYEEDWRALIGIKGAPLSTPNEVPIFRLSQLFQQEFKVTLTGEGADELFGGYVGPTLCALDYDRSFQNPSPVFKSALQSWYGADAFPDRASHFLRVNSWNAPSKLRDLFLADAVSPFPADEALRHYRERFRHWEQASTLDAYLRMHLEVNLEGLLSRLDSSTMAASVEGRVPFATGELATWAFSLPDAFKLRVAPGATNWEDRLSFDLARDGLVESKRVLRTAFAARVPTEILLRPKMSFPVPFIQWFQGSLREPYRDLLLGGSSFLAEMLPEAVRGQLANAEVVDPLLAWPLMNLAIWADTFQVSY